MESLLRIAPLIVCVLLFIAGRHMLIVAAAGGLLAMAIGGLSILDVSPLFLDTIRNSVGVETPIIYAALGGLLAEAGCFKALVGVCRHFQGRGHFILLVGILVFLQGLVTYMIGLGVSTTYLIAPILAHLTGGSPPVIAAMAIISAVGFSISPASPEAFITAQIAGRPVLDHAAAILPYGLFFYILAVLLAIYGARSAKAAIPDDKDGAPPLRHSLKRAFPAMAFLFLLIVGRPLNQAVGTQYFGPMLTLLIVCPLAWLCTPLTSERICRTFLESSRFVLVVLFAVGIFQGFMEIVATMGAFAELTVLVRKVPIFLSLPTAMVMGFLVAIPAAAFCTGVVAFMLPAMASMGLDSVSLGFITISIALGAHLSPVQVNIGALADTFGVPAKKIIRGNIPYITGALLIAILLAVVVCRI